MSSNRSPLVQLTLDSFKYEKNIKKFNFKKDDENSDNEMAAASSSSSYKKKIIRSDSDSETEKK
jgi:hypothetical protein